MKKISKHVSKREQGRLRRKARIRERISGTKERPRLCVFKSTKHLYVQLIDDSIGSTLVGLSTLSKSLKGKVKATVGGAKELGKKIAEQALEKGIQNVIFDRGGFRYHGQLKALADAAREAGLKF
ncbi:MAG: 50S ribosomal protein L18 [Deltaproteobacteria bacterium]|nr:50S ribosomal protein L18 [Deltaproteobacteria bacterium]